MFPSWNKSFNITEVYQRCSPHTTWLSCVISLYVSVSFSYIRNGNVHVLSWFTSCSVLLQCQQYFSTFCHFHFLHFFLLFLFSHCFYLTLLIFLTCLLSDIINFLMMIIFLALLDCLLSHFSYYNTFLLFIAYLFFFPWSE